MSAIAFYPNTFNQDFLVVSPENTIQSIITGDYENNVTYLRSLNKREYDAEKKKMPAVCWAGIFESGTRSKATIKTYSGLVVIDIDKLELSAISLLKQQLYSDEYVRYCFVSPSGTGLKIVIHVNTSAEQHRSAFIHLQNYIESKYLVKVDPSGKDVSRLCYMSWDPQAIINNNSKTFEVDLKYGDVISEYVSTYDGLKTTHEATKIFNVCVKWIENGKSKFIYTEGGRNVYIHALACAMNRCGVKQQDTINLITQHYITPDIKWHQSVRSAYFHNQHEHNSVQIKDVTITDFIAPEYIQNYTDDVTANDLMRITGMLFSRGVPNNEIMHLVSKIGIYYESQGYIDLKRSSLTDIMNKAVEVLQTNIANRAAQNSLSYMSAEDIIDNLLEFSMNDNAISTGLKMFDDEMFGGLLPCNLYGLVGMGESFKSVFAQFICFVNALNGIPSLYLNGEMSVMQWYERFIYMVFNTDLREEVSSGRISKSTANDFKRQVIEITKNNIFVVNSTGFSKLEVLSTIEHIESTTGKKIKILVTDGITQMNWANKTEINATIDNSMICKEIAKEAHGGQGVAHIALVHISGDIKRHYRETGSYVRGGKKVLANFDGYFCTSRLIDPATNSLVNEDDMLYIKGKFYLRYVDKRSRTGTVNAIINVGGSLKLEIENTDPNMYEIKINKNAKQY